MRWSHPALQLLLRFPLAKPSFAGVCSLALLISCASPAHSPTPKEPTTVRKVSSPDHELLGAPAKQAMQAGAEHFQVLAHGAGIPGDSIDATVFVPGGRCALVLARAGSRVGDLDLYAFADDGAELGRDEAPDEVPTLLLCADHDQRALVSARIAQGRGEVALGLLDVSQADRNVVLDAVGAQKEKKGKAGGWPGLEQALSLRRAELGGDWVDQRRVALPVDSRLPTYLSVTIPADRCADIFVISGPEVLQLDLEALDEEGRIFARGRPQGNTRGLLVCSNLVSQAISLRLRPHSGRGTALIMISRTKTRADRKELHPEIPLYDLVPSQRASLPDEPESEPDRSISFSLAVGRIDIQKIDITGCSRIDILPQEPLLGHRIQVHDPSGALLGQIEGLAPGTFFVCARRLEAERPLSQPSLDRPRNRPSLRDGLQDAPPPASTKVRLSAEARTRAGPLEMVLRSEHEIPDALQRHPLAASRLLGLASDLGFLKMPRDIGRVTKRRLSPDQIERLEMEIPARRCLTLMVALDGGPRGLTILAIDSRTGRTIDLARGAHRERLRVCGDRGGTRRVVFEMTTSHFPGDALFATRLTSL